MATGCLLCLPSFAFAGGPKICMTAEEAAKTPNKDVCVTAHIYEVVELPDGTRFLDCVSATNAGRVLPLYHHEPS